MIVHVPPALHSYTRGATRVEAEGETLSALLEDVERRYPGLRFRIVDERARVREHIKLFVDSQVVEDLGRRLEGSREVHVVCALSGG